MTGLRDFHTSVFDFATKVMLAVESQRGDSGRSSHVTATIAFAGDEVITNITIACTAAQNTEQRHCVVVWENRVTSAASWELDAQGKVRSRAGPPKATYRTGDHSTKPATRHWRIYS